MAYNIVKLERVQNLREVWSHEQHDFSQWLAKDGLELLGEEVGLDSITEPKCEAMIDGNKRIDIVAKGKCKGIERKVIIENQLEATNHDHLGKIVTYAAGRENVADSKDAADPEFATVIWIVAKATVEHRKAVDWLNRRTDNYVEFYLVEVQLLKINATDILPRFNVIVRPAPSDMKFKDMTEMETFYMGFWTEFNKYADSIPPHFFSDENFNCPQKPHPGNSYDLCVKGHQDVKATIIVRKKECLVKTGIYIPNNRGIFDRLSEHKDEIVNAFGSEIDFYSGNGKATGVWLVHEFKDFDNVKGQNEIFAWICDTIMKWKDFIKKYC